MVQLHHTDAVEIIRSHLMYINHITAPLLQLKVNLQPCAFTSLYVRIHSSLYVCHCWLSCGPSSVWSSREADDADDGSLEEVSQRKEIDWLYAETVFSFSDMKRM